MQKRGLGLVLVAVCVMLSVATIGCKTTIVDEGMKTEATYSMGSLEAKLATDIDTAYKAVQASTRELELNTTMATKDALAATVVARDSSDNKITIDLKSITDKSTMLEIRVGVMGDESKSKTIYNKIKQKI